MNLLNTLFVLTSGAYVAKEGLNLLVRLNGETVLRVPVAGLGGVACFGHITVSPAALKLCLDSGLSVSFFTESGRLFGRLEGPSRGGLALRRAQFAACSNPDRTREIARSIVAGKVINSRQVLLRRAREAAKPDDQAALRTAADHLARLGPSLKKAASIDEIRGYEGDAGARYFSVISRCFTDPEFKFERRSRRPPKDPVNALLSFSYSLLLGECTAALQGVGLDPDAGFLHSDRPGRPSLALDLMEELRAALCDRLVIAVLNRGQIRPDDFERSPSGGVTLKDSSRREFIASWQRRKQEPIEHPLIGQATQWALIPHLQARLLARHLRGDLEVYPPFTVR